MSRILTVWSENTELCKELDPFFCDAASWWYPIKHEPYPWPFKCSSGGITRVLDGEDINDTIEVTLDGMIWL